MSEDKKYEFKAEIKKLLYILSQSLYQNKEIFLRELISNSADSMKKMHFISLQDKNILNPELDLEIEITINGKEKTITISDTGIGMSKDEIITNLGTIAGSGSEKFLEALNSTDENKDKKIDLDIIGQFGVGFYSVFMVADKVKVITKSYKKDEPSIEWESDGTGEFTVNPGNKEERGTDVIIYLRDDESDYLHLQRIESIIKKYSNFVSHPIYVAGIEDDTNKTEVDMDEDDDKVIDGEIVEESSEESKDVSKKGTEKESVKETENEPEKVPEERKPVNEIEPLWKRSASDISDEDYKNFYNYISHRYDNYSQVIRYNVDGRVQFRSILFIPESSSKDMFQSDTEFGLALYSKNVMIMENCKDLIPTHFRFVKGIVDSEDIALNVSRDTIQSNRVIKKIKELVTKRILKELNDLKDNETEKYLTFWKAFGVFIKEGIVSSYDQREKLIDLLEFKTSNTKKDEFINLKQYTERMPEDQNDIYYLVGENMNTLKISPHLGYYKNKGIEVIFMDEPIDNFLMMNIHEYKETMGEGEDAEEKTYLFKPIDVTEEKEEDTSKEGEDKDKADSEKDKKDIPEDTQKFLDKVMEILGEKIMDATVSDKLYGNACRLANKANGMSSSMQRAMRYYTQTSQGGKSFEIPKKIFEFDSEHPITKGLIKLNKATPDNGKINAVVEQLFENCLLSEGDLPDPSLMVPRINQLVEMLITGNDNVKNIAVEETEDKEAKKPEEKSEEKKSEEIKKEE